MEEIAMVKLTEASTQLLKKLVGERICYFFTDNIKVEATSKAVSYWAPEFALGLKTNRGDLTFINISADYKLTDKRAATYYEFAIEESKVPLRREKLLQSGLHSEIKVLSSQVLLIEVYQNHSTDANDTITYDAAIVFYTDTQKYMLKAREELIGGVDIILDEPAIEAELLDLRLRQSLV